MAKNQHVVRHSGGGAIRGEDSSRGTRVTSTQWEAIDIARTISRNQGSELVIHGRDSRIRARDSFGNDPLPAKGKLYDTEKAYF